VVGILRVRVVSCLFTMREGVRKAMNVAIWHCTGCSRYYEGEWLGGAWLMASECPYCGCTGCSNAAFVKPYGTLLIKDEKKI
jgi:hypothetical protein